jgi:hypothetical protein
MVTVMVLERNGYGVREYLSPVVACRYTVMVLKSKGYSVRV